MVMMASTQEEQDRKIVLEFIHLLEKSKQLFNGLRYHESRYLLVHIIHIFLTQRSTPIRPPTMASIFRTHL